MRFPIGQVFRVPRGTHREDDESFPDLRAVTKGRWKAGLDIQKGIFFFAEVVGPGDERRRPAFIFHSNNMDKASESNPWLDVIEEDRGFALYHGDNKSPRKGALDSRGNRAFAEIMRQYSEPALRNLAPPVLVTQQLGLGSPGLSYRRFSGFGVPTDVRVQTQASRNGHFLNLAIELALFGLEAEDGLFDWAWIDARRDPTVDAYQANRIAPEAWRRWTRGGDEAVGRLRRDVLRSRIASTSVQRELSKAEREVIESVYAYYSSHPHGFEGLASLITARVLGPRCVRGWVTKRAGDGGIDFVQRLDVGTSFSTVPLVVLGQAKLRPPAKGTVGGQDLARVVARLRRGWVGAFVTTAVFTPDAQAELFSDAYPVVLINGQRVAQELLKEMAESGRTLLEIFEHEVGWYNENISARLPDDITKDHHLGKTLWQAGASARA